MTIRLTKANLKKLVGKMKKADATLLIQSAEQKESAMAEFGRVHFAEFFEETHWEDGDSIVEANWWPEVTAMVVNGVHFEEEEVRTILRLNSPHQD
jgi:hypothetical protein